MEKVHDENTGSTLQPSKPGSVNNVAAPSGTQKTGQGAGDPQKIADPVKPGNMGGGTQPTGTGKTSHGQESIGVLHGVGRSPAEGKV